MGTNKCASQSGMTAYGTRRHLYDPKNQILPPMDHSTISLQMGTNKCASQGRQRLGQSPPVGQTLGWGRGGALGAGEHP
uniref:Calponin-2 n=1 Tax=Anas platyrhynchos platyrhynchos TaxID=8840 RepID=A0A493TMX7_ANAPP